jgi:hypothetical protein
LTPETRHLIGAAAYPQVSNKIVRAHGRIVVSWLATIERPYGSRPLDGPPGLVYTHGGSGVSNTLDRASAEVVFVQLAAGDAGGRLGRGATR